MSQNSLLIGLCCAVSLLPEFASADSNAKIAAFLESDLRRSLPGKTMPAGVDTDKWLRLENTAGISAYLSSGDTSAMADLKLVYFGGSTATEFTHLTDRNKIDPYRIESAALYLEFSDLLPGIDLRLGRQIIEWGSADQFNPTNPVNALDLEDPLKFGDRVPNEMAVLTWTAPWTVETDDTLILDEFSISLVAVPVFRPGILPESGQVIFEDAQLLAQQASSESLADMAALNGTFVESGGSVSYDVTVNKPKLTTDNVQYGVHMGMNIVGVNLGFSYYRGFSDIAYPAKVTPDVQGPDSVMSQLALAQGLSVEEITGLLNNLSVDLTGTTVNTHVELQYPEIQMVGAQMSTSLEFLDGLGLWAEVAMVMHDDLTLELDVPFLDLNEIETTVPKGNFIKVAAGMDYTFTSWLYMNIQYLRGFVDEFGKDALNNYIIAVTDVKFFDDVLLTRLSAIYHIDDQSAVLYPNIVATVWENTELSVGAFVYQGGQDSKFGSPATGHNLVFVKGRYAF